MGRGICALGDPTIRANSGCVSTACASKARSAAQEWLSLSTIPETVVKCVQRSPIACAWAFIIAMNRPLVPATRWASALDAVWAARGHHGPGLDDRRAHGYVNRGSRCLPRHEQQQRDQREHHGQNDERPDMAPGPALQLSALKDTHGRGGCRSAP